MSDTATADTNVDPAAGTNAGGADGGQPPAGGAPAGNNRGPTMADIAAEDTIATGDDGKPVMPDWLNGQTQFWDPDKGEVRVQELAKSQRDLRAQLSRSGKDKPEPPPESADAYTLPQVEGLPADFFKADDPLLANVKAAAHAAGVSQKQFEAMAKPYLEQVKAQLGANDPKALEEADRKAYAEEIKKLGPDGKAIVHQAFAWVRGLKERGILTADEEYQLHAISSAAGVTALLKLQQMAGGPPIPTDAITENSASEQDARQMLADGYARNDPALIEKGNKAIRALIAKGVLPETVR